MLRKNFLLITIITILAGCSQTSSKKISVVPREVYPNNNSCEEKVALYLRVHGRINRDNALDSLNEIYHRELLENIVHAMFTYTLEDETKTLEVKYDFNKKLYIPVLGIRKNDFEESLESSYLDFNSFKIAMGDKKMVYKESFYEFGSKKLMVEYANEKISKLYLGKDFNCRFDPNPQCTCARFFR